MKIRKILTIISFYLIFGQTFITAQNNEYSNMAVTIKFSNRTIYYPDNTESNPVNIHITIKNKGTDTLRFKLADNRMFSIDFHAYTVKNKQLKQTDGLIEKRTTNQTVYFREIALDPGEEYSFIENLKEYLVVDDPSLSEVDVSFYPELYKSKFISVNTNRLTLEVKPSPSSASSNYIPVKEESVEILRQEELSPDKVVEQTIIARQKSLWDQFFLYMDIESLIKRNPSLKNKFITVSEDERIRMVDAFKKDLMQSRIENDIIAVPEKFVIEKTTYTPTEGIVVVTEWFKYTNFRERKSYTYKVRQREGIWTIYDYTVVNLGTE